MEPIHPKSSKRTASVASSSESKKKAKTTSSSTSSTQCANCFTAGTVSAEGLSVVEGEEKLNCRKCRQVCDTCLKDTGMDLPLEGGERTCLGCHVSSSDEDEDEEDQPMDGEEINICCTCGEECATCAIPEDEEEYICRPCRQVCDSCGHNEGEDIARYGEKGDRVCEKCIDKENDGIDGINVLRKEAVRRHQFHMEHAAGAIDEQLEAEKKKVAEEENDNDSDRWFEREARLRLESIMLLSSLGCGPAAIALELNNPFITSSVVDSVLRRIEWVISDKKFEEPPVKAEIANLEHLRALCALIDFYPVNQLHMGGLTEASLRKLITSANAKLKEEIAPAPAAAAAAN